MIRIFSAGVTFALVAASSTGLAAQATPTQATPTQASPTPAMPMHELTFSEVKAQADRLWNRLDANHDGRIDRADRDARLLEHFAMADTNHDGVISKDEFLAAMRAREAKWKEHGRPAEMGHAEMGHAGMGHGEMEHGGPPPPGAPRDHPPDGMGMGMGTSIIGPALRGARSDGVITRAAFDAALKTRFDAIDANHDGRLSHEELREARRDAMYRDWKGRDHRMPPPPPPPGTGE